MGGKVDEKEVKSEPLDEASSIGHPRLNRKKRKSKIIASGEWTQCMFLLPKKKRYCNLSRVPGSFYCGNHINGSEGVSSKASLRFSSDLRERIPCPLDNSHTVYRYDLEKHLLICNAKKKKETMESLPYFRKDINSGKTQKTTPKVDHGLSLLHRINQIDYMALVKRIENAHTCSVSVIHEEILVHEACSDMHEIKKSNGGGQKILRHIIQQSSILGHLQKQNLLDPKNIFIEFGAGRGGLSFALIKAIAKADIILIDRSCSRRKMDSTIVHGGGECQRILIDIRDLNMEKINSVSDRPVVCLSKHLCGVATDLTLRALVNTLPNPSDAKVSPFLEGIAIALCCHQVCRWDDYINQDFFLRLGFDANDFDLMTSITAWATCGMNSGGASVQAALGFSRDERIEIGRKCKRLIDTGRILFLQSLGLNTKLIKYCTEEDSLENVLLLCWK